MTRSGVKARAAFKFSTMSGSQLLPTIGLVYQFAYISAPDEFKETSRRLLLIFRCSRLRIYEN
ncbi:predicted protein [Botrytis cinerea T4]|uniref:Uncharacterized protein n=1 Tax=Botryotinia fuckeliana (strain T4) TaxID=999810 RepID=G2XP09_BOTF4|nr:predicted protein [Botrytis cinerea T4]